MHACSLEWCYDDFVLVGGVECGEQSFFALRVNQVFRERVLECFTSGGVANDPSLAGAFAVYAVEYLHVQVRVDRTVMVFTLHADRADGELVNDDRRAVCVVGSLPVLTHRALLQ